MKKGIALVVLFIMLIGASSILYAEDVVPGPMRKLGRGLANVVTSPAEIVIGMGDATSKDGVAAGATWGLVQGLANMVKRMAVGAYEVVSFPIGAPDYKPIIDDPEFLFNKEPEMLKSHIPARY